MPKIWIKLLSRISFNDCQGNTTSRLLNQQNLMLHHSLPTELEEWEPYKMKLPLPKEIETHLYSLYDNIDRADDLYKGQ